MTAQKNTSEQRKEPRISGKIPLRIYQEGGVIDAETINISCSGAYCQVEKYIEPLTKLQIRLRLPFNKIGTEASKEISCQGAVVRSVPAKDKNLFDVAIFFNEISQQASEHIAKYIDYCTKLKEEKLWKTL